MKGCNPIVTERVTPLLGSFSLHGKISLRDQCLFVLGVKTGFRYAELTSLTIGDVFDNGHVKHSVYVKKRNTKGKLQGRCVPLHEEARAAILAYVQSKQIVVASEPLFLSQKRKPLSRPQFARLLKRAASRASVVNIDRISTHSMRKTFARKMREKFGPDLVKLQQALGHKCISSTAQYVDFNQDEINSAILE